jgi:hypothetical protein
VLAVDQRMAEAGMAHAAAQHAAGRRRGNPLRPAGSAWLGGPDGSRRSPGAPFFQFADGP